VSAANRPRPSFSIVVIARNEAHMLPRLLASVGEVLVRDGEVLVVDTGSDDESPDVARAAGARVVEAGDRFVAALGAKEAACIERRFARDGEGPLVQRGEPQFNFGQAREYAGSLAREDHILQVDASDELLALDVDVLDAVVRSPDSLRVEYRLQSSGLSQHGHPTRMTLSIRPRQRSSGAAKASTSGNALHRRCAMFLL
jgi:glycosyltransferase involved in cell wall biosynthesis